MGIVNYRLRGIGGDGASIFRLIKHPSYTPIAIYIYHFQYGQNTTQQKDNKMTTQTQHKHNTNTTQTEHKRNTNTTQTHECLY